MAYKIVVEWYILYQGDESKSDMAFHLCVDIWWATSDQGNCGVLHIKGMNPSNSSDGDFDGDDDGLPDSCSGNV